jgi:hypothetical protein
MNFNIFFGNPSAAVTPVLGYVVLDRTTGVKWDIYIEDGEFLYASTTAAASSEPIVEDLANSSNHWVLFIDDGQFGIESTATIQDDSIIITDTVTAINYILFVEDGQFGWKPPAIVGGFLPRLTLLGVG